MKRVLFLSLFFIASPAFGQVITLDETLVESAEPALINIATTTSPIVVATTSSSTIENIATTTEVTESITIVPGGLTLKLSSTVPVTNGPVADAVSSGDDGIFDLIYTGFEEFVFKVFGV